MNASTKTKKNRKAATKVERNVHVYGAESDPMLIVMTIGKDRFAYFVKRIPADYGVGFEFRKANHCFGEANANEVYHVHYDRSRRLSSCDCLGGLKHSHCKHQEAIVALIQAGKLAVLETKKAEPKSEPKAATPQRCGICSQEQCRCDLDRLHATDVYNMRLGRVAFINGHRIEKLMNCVLIDERKVYESSVILELLASNEKILPLTPAPAAFNDFDDP